MMALGFLGTSVYTGCSWFNQNRRFEPESLYFYKNLIAELAETIIPATDTPGAKDAHVDEFIIRMIIENESSKTQNRFLSGLRNLQDYSIKTYNKNFQDCSLLDRIDILEYYENKASHSRILMKIENKLLGEPFLHKLKSLTVIGFCTSEIGATKALAYDYVPVNYLACVPLLKGQKSWATS
jgi:hypothetical protein